MSNRVGVLYLVATPLGNLGDLSPRAVEVLRGVARIAAEDTRHSRPLLVHCGIDTPLFALHEHNEIHAGEQVLALLGAGKDIALISDAGTPLISDPGFPLVRAAHEQGFAVIPIPGPSALIAALSVSGLPTDRFRFEGFPPRTDAARRRHLRELSGERATLIFYEASHRILDLLAACRDVFGADRLAFVGREMTKLHQELRRAPLGALCDHFTQGERRGEFVLVVGGKPEHETADWPPEVGEVLSALARTLPAKRAADLVARLTGLPRNALYRALHEQTG